MVGWGEDRRLRLCVAHGLSLLSAWTFLPDTGLSLQGSGLAMSLVSRNV